MYLCIYVSMYLCIYVCIHVPGLRWQAPLGVVLTLCVLTFFARRHGLPANLAHNWRICSLLTAWKIAPLFTYMSHMSIYPSYLYLFSFTWSCLISLTSYNLPCLSYLILSCLKSAYTIYHDILITIQILYSITQYIILSRDLPSYGIISHLNGS